MVFERAGFPLLTSLSKHMMGARSEELVKLPLFALLEQTTDVCLKAGDNGFLLLKVASSA